MKIVRQQHELEGADLGGIGASLIFVDVEPGRGPSLHTHDYEELLIVLEGRATLRGTGDEEVVVGAGEIVVVPAGEPHGFFNSGDGPLRQIDVHLNPRFETDWLEGQG